MVIIKLNNYAQCLICGMNIIPKKYNIERSYNHGTMESLMRQDR